MAKKNLVNVDGDFSFPNGFTISDNRIEDCLQRHVSPAAYVVWRQYLRFWGGDKKIAYPSLSLLSERTGLSEKTIRKCNKELVCKGYLKYTSGNSSRANNYYYVSIEDLVKRYEIQENIKNESTQNTKSEGDDFLPIKEHNKISSKITEQLSELRELDRSIAKAFLNEFQDVYKNQFGIAYPLETRDMKAIISNIEELRNQFTTYRSIISQYMKSKNKFIEESDHSIFFFFRPKVVKSIVSEFGQTDIGRWIMQAKKIIDELQFEIDKMNEKDIEIYLNNKIKNYLNGANSQRDEFVAKYIREHFSR